MKAYRGEVSFKIALVFSFKVRKSCCHLLDWMTKQEIFVIMKGGGTSECYIWYHGARCTRTLDFPPFALRFTLRWLPFTSTQNISNLKIRTPG